MTLDQRRTMFNTTNVRYLTDELKEKACRLCEQAGADFVKTSTGYGTGGATLEDLHLMRNICSPGVQV